MSYSVRNIVIALVAAVAAAVAVLVYTTSFKDQVTRQQERVRVMVATRDIPEGTPGREATGSMELREVLAADMTPGALTASGGLDGKVAAQTVYAGQQVVGQVFQQPATQAPSLQLRPDQRGVRVQVERASGALGAVEAGDTVDVFGSFTAKDPVTGEEVTFTRRVLTAVPVLEVPPAADAKKEGKSLSENGERGSQELMLAVSQADATKVSFMQATQDSTVMWVAVRPPDAQAKEADVTVEELSSMLLDGLPRAEQADLRRRLGSLLATPAERAALAGPDGALGTEDDVAGAAGTDVNATDPADAAVQGE